MPSTKTRPRPDPSGFTRPVGASRSGWLSWFRDRQHRHAMWRAGVFVVGLLLILVGAAMWLVSALLAAPPAFAGLWVWSREFHWGHRLFRWFLRRARSLWSRARERPMRWGLITLGGIGAAGAAYWAWGRYGPW